MDCIRTLWQEVLGAYCGNVGKIVRVDVTFPPELLKDFDEVIDNVVAEIVLRPFRMLFDCLSVRRKV